MLVMEMRKMMKVANKADSIQPINGVIEIRAGTIYQYIDISQH